jgi:predicted component of type VI protein secretion system
VSAKLVFLSGDLEGAVVSLLDQGFTIGRNPEEDLVLPDEVVSRLQASLRYRDGQYLIRDEASTNGTFVNDRRITEQVLHDGDIIEYGLGGPSARFEAEAPVQGAAEANDGGPVREAVEPATPPQPRAATAVFQTGDRASARPATGTGPADETAVKGFFRSIRARPRRPFVWAGLAAVLASLAIAIFLLID